jgi:hypothetical protein
MSRLLIELDQPAAIQNTERKAFLDRAEALLRTLDADSFRRGGSDDVMIGKTHTIRIDGPDRKWNRATFHDVVTEKPVLNAIIPSMLVERLRPRSRFDAARSILTMGIAVSGARVGLDDDAILELKDTVRSAALAAAVALARPVSAMMPTPWWACMEHWTMRQVRPTSGFIGRTPLDDFLQNAGSGGDTMTAVTWRTVDLSCPTILMGHSMTGRMTPENEPLMTMRAVERWRPLLERTGMM